MSAEALARFVTSDEGKLYAKVCRISGVDPAAHLVGFDEVLAHDFRLACLIARDTEPDEEPVAEGSGFVTDLAQVMARMR